MNALVFFYISFHIKQNQPKFVHGATTIMRVTLDDLILSPFPVSSRRVPQVGIWVVGEVGNS